MPLKNKIDEMSEDKTVWHLSKGNNYGDKSPIACVPSRVKLPKGHTWSQSIKEINCPACLEVMIQKRLNENEYLREVQKANRHRINTCQKGLKIEVKAIRDFRPDPEMLERIRAGL